MASTHRKHGCAFKAKVALEAIKGEKTVADLCQEHGLAASQIFAWRKQLTEGCSTLFENAKKDDHKEEIDRLHRIIGQLTVERDFLDHVLKR